ncbi:MAG: hypothetical protein VX944_09680, partial [Myxococcota bacterium]|nr:hypothetical protein [Myxococcota bacterium]
GDGTCDDSYELFLNCAEFDFDDGDCESTGSGGSGSTGPCSDAGDVEDCNGDCYPESWVGDGVCEDDSWGPDFDCPAFDSDGGDCDPSADGGGDDSACTDAGDIEDCNGDCFPESWIGDGICEDGTTSWGGDFDCAEFESDGGDCSSSSGGFCVFDSYFFDSLLGSVVMDTTASKSSDWDLSCDLTGHDSGDVAFKWTPGTTRTYSVSATGTDFDAVIAIFEADCSTELECGDDGASGATEEIVRVFDRDTTYYIVVSGYYFYSEGSFTLQIAPAG